jgi:hypothetical protein
MEEEVMMTIFFCRNGEINLKELVKEYEMKKYYYLLLKEIALYFLNIISEMEM